MGTVRDQKEFIRLARNHHCQVIADTFTEAMHIGESICSGKINAGLANFVIHF